MPYVILFVAMCMAGSVSWLIGVEKGRADVFYGRVACDEQRDYRANRPILVCEEK